MAPTQKTEIERDTFRRTAAGILALAATSLGGPASAQDEPKSMQELFVPLAHGACVTIDEVRKVGATVQLTPDQFQFVRAFYMAVPPVSHELPPGDKAFLAKGPEGVTVLGLVDSDSGQVCAVFEATDWLQRLVDQVGRGETGKKGAPINYIGGRPPLDLKPDYTGGSLVLKL